MNDELFTGKPKSKKPAPTLKVEPLGEGEGRDVRQIETPPARKAEAVEPREDVVLKNIENACGGNRYLEAMILGEILNAPKGRR